MQGPAPAQADEGGPSWADDSGGDPPSPLSTLVRSLPESVKLALASLFVALTLHAFFAARRGGEQDRDGPSVRGHVGAVGSGVTERVDQAGAGESAGVDSGSGSTGAGAGGQMLGGDDPEPAQAAGKRKKAKRDAAADRNYDALICKKEEEIATESESKADDVEDEAHDTATGKEHTESEPKREEASQPNGGGGHILGSDGNAASSAAENTNGSPPPMQLHSKTNHPGLQGYYNWVSTITSLYRVYAIPSYSDGGGPNGRQFHEAILPMHPSSERGKVPLHIEVTNRSSRTIEVYWIDYKGNEVRRGSMPPRGGVWVQTTFIGHPWTFRCGPGEEGVVLKYAPFRVMPSIVGAETSRVDQGGDVEGMQRFTIREVPEGFVSRIGGLTPVCWVEDAILPEPPLIDTLRTNAANVFTSSELEQAIKWSCQQIQREDAIYHGNGIVSAKRLLQYLKNVCLHPDEPKYRKLRLGNRIFQSTVYNTGARGVLLALGFEEHRGHMECGPGGGRMLPHERIRQISDAMVVVDRTLRIIEDESGAALAQPEGGDGFGRAGFGHAGGMNI